MPSRRSRRSRRGRTSGLDIHSNPYKYFSHKLNLDPKGDNIEAIVDDFNYLKKNERLTAEGAAIVLLRQFGYVVDKKAVKEGDELDTYLETMKPTGSNKLSEYLFIELSTKNTYSLRGKNIGHYEEALEGGSMPCMYPFPCSNHILKFKHNGKDVYFPPIVDRPENNNNVPDQDFVQVYTVNGKHYVHHSTGLTMNGPTLGGRRRTRKRHRRSR
jgi:hypothetical protein